MTVNQVCMACPSNYGSVLVLASADLLHWYGHDLKIQKLRYFSTRSIDFGWDKMWEANL